MTDSAHLEAVAEAIYKAPTAHNPFLPVPWPFDELNPEDRATFLRMAQAAIDALQLTEETAFRYTHLASGRSTIIEADSSDVRVARKIAGDTHELSQVSRLASGWLRVDGGDA